MACKLGWCCPRLRGPSSSAVPTFQPDGRFVGGISCGLSCQHTNNYCRSTVTGCDRWTQGQEHPGHHLPLASYLKLKAQAFCIYTQFLLTLVQQGRTPFTSFRKANIREESYLQGPTVFSFLAQITSYQFDCLKLDFTSTTQEPY